MFGSIGLPELIIIFVLALLLFGPRKLPEIGRTRRAVLSASSGARPTTSSARSRRRSRPRTSGRSRDDGARCGRLCRLRSTRLPKARPRGRAGGPGPKSPADRRRRPQPANDPAGALARHGRRGARGGPGGDELTRMSLLEHLDELRRRIGYSLLAVVGGFMACWYFAKPIFALARAPDHAVPAARATSWRSPA